MIQSSDALPVLGRRKRKICLKTDSRPFSQHCLLDAQDDLSAVATWLHEYRDKKTTFETYQREANRLLLWCTYEIGKNLAQLTKDDFHKFIKFLLNPPARWCMARHGKKQQWRPFYGALTQNSMQKSIRILNSLLNYLVDADYLRANPLKLIKNTQNFSYSPDVQKYAVWQRMLDDEEWQAIQTALKNLPGMSAQEYDKKIRTQFLFAILYFLGLRLNEIASHDWNAFRYFQNSWWFFVKGKGDKLGHIPVNDQLLNYVRAYRLHLGLRAMPKADENIPIFYTQRRNKALSSRVLYQYVKDVGEAAAALFPDDHYRQEKLKKLSPHWLRHLSASHQDRLGIPLTIIQANHRHASSQTTQIYIHASDQIRSGEMQKMTMDIKPNFTEKKQQNIALRIKGGGINPEQSIKNFLSTLDDFVLIEHKIQRNFESIDNAAHEFKNRVRLGGSLLINYFFSSSLNTNELKALKTQIQQEAEARLLQLQII